MVKTEKVSSLYRVRSAKSGAILLDGHSDAVLVKGKKEEVHCINRSY